MSSHDDENREHSRPTRWEGEAPSHPPPQERGPGWVPAQGATGHGSPWDRRAQGRASPEQEPARWEQGRSDTRQRADAPWSPSNGLGSTRSAGWGSQPGAGLGAGDDPAPQSAVYGSGQWGRSGTQDWPGAWGGQSGTGYGPAGPGHSGYGQEEAGQPHTLFDDHDYQQWRQEQLRKLDSEYLAWRQERYRKFADDFDAWRSRREPGATTAAATTNATAPPAQASPGASLSPDATAAGPHAPHDSPLTASKPK